MIFRAIYGKSHAVSFLPMIHGKSHPVSLLGLVFVVLFVGVRVAAYAYGLRFDASEAAAFWHFIEPELLRERLLESIFYLHAQPPLFNLWLGIYHKLFGEAMPLAFAITYAALGVMLCVQMNAVGRALGVSRWLRTIGVAVFCTSPAVLLYENFLLYAYPVAVLLTWSAARFHRALETGRERDWWVFSAIVLAVVLMRALYHPLWLLLVFCGSTLLLWGRGSFKEDGSNPSRRRTELSSLNDPRPHYRLVRPALVAIVVVAALMTKNQIVFGHVSLSSFSGMNLSRVVLDRMSGDDVVSLVADGALSSWATTGGFRELSEYVPAPQVAPTGVLLLDRPFKADGSVNFHHRAYIEISDRLARDSWAVIRAQPSAYLSSVLENVRQTLHAASTYAPLSDARERIAPLVRVYEPALGWIPALGAMGVWPILLPLVLIVNSAELWRRRVSRDARWALVAYLLFNIVYVIGVGALMERSENQRFRFDVDPMIWLLLLASLQRPLSRHRTPAATPAAAR